MPSEGQLAFELLGKKYLLFGNSFLSEQYGGQSPSIFLFACRLLSRDAYPYNNGSTTGITLSNHLFYQSNFSFARQQVAGSHSLQNNSILDHAF